MIQENLLDFGGQPCIFSAVLGGLPVFPGVIATLGNLQRLAEHCDGVGVSVLCNELKFHPWLREKMPIAFLICRAPVAATHSLASDGEFPLLAEFDVHSPGTLALPAQKTADTNDAVYCLRYPDRVQFALMAFYSIARVVPLPLFSGSRPSISSSRRGIDP